MKKKTSLSTVYWQFIQYAYYSLHWLLPDTTEARHLYNYAQSLELLDDPLNNQELSTEGLDREYTCTENIRSEMFGKWNQAHWDATLLSSRIASPLAGRSVACLTNLTTADAKDTVIRMSSRAGFCALSSLPVRGRLLESNEASKLIRFYGS